MSTEVHAPNDWEDRLLGEVAEITLGGTPSTEVAGFWGGNIPWMASGEVNKRHVFEVEGRITEAGLGASNATLVDPPAVAIGLAGQGKTRGTAALVHFRVCTNQSIAMIKGKNGKLDTGFLFHNLENRYEELRSRSSGGGRAGLSREILQQIPMSLPSPAEQSRIAAVLDTVDEAIARTEAVIAKLQQMRTGLLHDLLTRGLDEHGQLRDLIAHPEQFQDSMLGRIPLKWEVQSLESVTDPSTPICYGIVQAMEFVPDGVPVLTIRDLLGDYSTGLHRTARNIDANYARSRVRPDDVLISVKGTIGRVAVVPQHFQGNISRDLARIRPNDRVRARFLVHLLRSPRGQRILEQAQVGTTRGELSIAPLKRLSFAFPLPAEQERIAMLLDEHDAVIRSHEHEFEKLGQLKSGLMTDLLTGRVRVPESVPAPENQP